MTGERFCELVGISERSLRRYVQRRGMPGVFDARGALAIPHPAGMQWFQTYLVEKATRAPSMELEEAHRRRDIARAGLAELKLAHEKGLVAYVEDFEREIVTAYSAVRSKLLNLSHRAAPLIYAAKTREDAEGAVRPLVDEMLEELQPRPRTKPPRRRHPEKKFGI